MILSKTLCGPLLKFLCFPTLAITQVGDGASSHPHIVTPVADGRESKHGLWNLNPILLHKY